MIIGVDGKPLLMQKTGIGIYTDRLLASMLNIDQQLSATVYLPFSLGQSRKSGRQFVDDLRRQFPARTEFVSSYFPPKLRRWIWQSSDMMKLDRLLGRVDIYHATNLVMPPLQRAKGVFSIYDLTFMLFPGFHVKGMQAFSRATRIFANRADCLLAISEHTKRDVIELLGIPAERIRVTLLAADERYRVINDTSMVTAVAEKYGIDREYILYTGTLEPRKNVPALIRAFHALKREQKIPHLLVIAGKKGWLYDDIYNEVRALGMEDEVIFTGYVSDEDMPSLYNGASVFAYPSYYEGFGLPPLEAMACGCPVVTSNSSSLPEVVGDAGLMVDPHRPEELAEAIGRIVFDSGLRSDLREKGLQRAAGFSWRRCAEETLAAYRELL